MDSRRVGRAFAIFAVKALNREVRKEMPHGTQRKPVPEMTARTGHEAGKSAYAQSKLP
jgi:hypothetical protein